MTSHMGEGDGGMQQSMQTGKRRGAGPKSAPPPNSSEAGGAQTKKTPKQIHKSRKENQNKKGTKNK